MKAITIKQAAKHQEDLKADKKFYACVVTTKSGNQLYGEIANPVEEILEDGFLFITTQACDSFIELEDIESISFELNTDNQ